MMNREQMRIKSYFARSVDQAMAQAREELGPEAMLLNTRKAQVDQIEGGGYEVIFGVAGEAPEVPSIVPFVAAAPAAEVERRVENSAPEHFAAELGRLHDQIDEIRNLLVRSSRAQVTAGRTVPELADVYARLMSADVEPALSKDIVDRLEASMATDAFFAAAGPDKANTANRWKTLRSDAGRLEAFVRVELENRVALAPHLGAGPGPGAGAGASIDEQGNPVVLLVGPRGAGKTTSLAKLAVSRVRSSNAGPVRLLSLDMSRTAAHLQLQSVASTYKMTFEEVPAAYLLPGLIAEARQQETIFVDTPGYTGADANAADAAAAALAECPQLDVHLVVPGYMKARDLRFCIEKYARFRPTKLLVTKMDETDSFGSIFSEAARAGLKLSFVAYGPAIPQDIRPVSSEDLLSMALEREKERAQRVA
jgi:flagellar biosynthesis protein FlhF